MGAKDPVGKIRRVKLDGSARCPDDQAGTAGGLIHGSALVRRRMQVYMSDLKERCKQLF